MSANHYDAGKPQLSLIPREAQEQEARVLAYGAKKYSRYNWRAGMKWSKLADSTQRHLLAWIGGEDKDPETGESHLAHARADIGFLLAYEQNGLGRDDRYKVGLEQERFEDPVVAEPLVQKLEAINERISNVPAWAVTRVKSAGVFAVGDEVVKNDSDDQGFYACIKAGEVYTVASVNGSYLRLEGVTGGHLHCRVKHLPVEVEK